MLRRLFGLACAGALCRPAWAQWDACCAERVCVSTAALTRALHAFEALANDAATMPLAERIGFVNAAINQRVAHADDVEQFGADVWLTPLETLALARGDCEDKAIAKYFVLLAAGVPPAALRLLYARYTPSATPARVLPHVVALARLPFVDPLALDSINPLAVALSQRDDLEPVLTFDTQRIWVAVQGPDGGCAPQRLRPWRELLQRIDAQPRWRA